MKLIFAQWSLNKSVTAATNVCNIVAPKSAFEVKSIINISYTTKLLLIYKVWQFLDFNSSIFNTNLPT